MYDHGFRQDQNDIRDEEYEKTIPRELTLLEVLRRLVFPHCDFEDMIMNCTRKWFGRLELTYMF